MAEGLIFQLNFLIPVFCSVATHAPRATISKFEKQWNISVVNYQVQESSEALFTAVRGGLVEKTSPLDPKLDYCEWKN